MNKVNVKIVVNRNNTTIGYLDEPIKGNNNFVMKQQLSKKKNVE